MSHFPYPQASLIVTLGIPLLALLAVSLIVLFVSRASRHGRRIALLAGAWLVFTAVLGSSGFLARSDASPLRILVLMAPTLVLPFALGLSALGGAVAKEIPLAWLVGFHGFRLPLELVMHQAAVEGVMPEQMTFTGFNLDIVTGASALGVALLLLAGKAPRWLVLTWNALGSLLLLAIMAIAIASLPRFHAFGSEAVRVNTWVSHFPFVWLPAGLVTSALFGHVVIWRRLLFHFSPQPPRRSLGSADDLRARVV